jgi:hypothetical protein
MEGSPFYRLTEEAIGELEEQGKGTVGHLCGASGRLVLTVGWSL